MVWECTLSFLSKTFPPWHGMLLKERLFATPPHSHETTNRSVYRNICNYFSSFCNYFSSSTTLVWINESQIWRENNFQILKISRLCLTSTCVFEIRLEFPMDVLRDVLHIFFRTRVRVNCQWCARDSSRILSIAFQPTFHHRVRWYISSLLLSGQYLRWDLYSSAISKAE